MGKTNNISKHRKKDEESKRKVKKLKNVLKKHKKEKKKDIEEAMELSLSKSKMHDSQITNKTANDTSQQPSSSNRMLGPMTKKEWEKKQSIIQRVYDEETGRQRLIKGDGEVLEEIVSRKHNKEINKQATRVDGIYFLKRLQVNSL